MEEIGGGGGERKETDRGKKHIMITRSKNPKEGWAPPLSPQMVKIPRDSGVEGLEDRVPHISFKISTVVHI